MPGRDHGLNFRSRYSHESAQAFRSKLRYDRAGRGLGSLTVRSDCGIHENMKLIGRMTRAL